MNRISLSLLLVALALSGVSAYYSIVGLAAIFAASFWSVLILATVLEVGKLVLVSWLYRNWHVTPWPIKTYLTVAVMILMAITSLGIFGFLSKAHSEDQTQSQQTQLQITQINTQIETRQQQLLESREIITQLNRSINIQLDANRPQQALVNRRTQQAERDRVQARMDQLQAEILQLTESRTQMQSGQTIQESKLGPVRYVVAIVNPDADPHEAVKWIILVLVIVCDPLAVCMLMAANQNYKKTVPEQADSPQTNMRWDPVHNVMMIADQNNKWHMWQPATTTAPVADKQAEIKDQVKLVEQTITELLRQRPIFELSMPMWQGTGGTSVPIQTPEQASVPAATTASEPSLDPDMLQRMIVDTLENWMNRTLTVTYSADQEEIGRIVEKVIQQTLHQRTQTDSDTQPEISVATPAVQMDVAATAATTHEEEDTVSQQAAEPELEKRVPQDHTPVVDLTYVPEPPESTEKSDQSGTGKPIYNYFGEERIRGGKKHIPTT